MALTKLTEDVSTVSKLDNEPNDVGGLTAEELRAKFDEAGEIIKKYLNDILLTELQSPAGAASLGAILAGKEMTLQDALDVLSLAAVKEGNMPLGGNAGDVLCKRSDATYDVQWVPNYVTVTFTEEEWVKGEDGFYTIRLPQTVHKRTGPYFGCNVRSLSEDGRYLSNTWAVLETGTAYDGDTGEIELYSGSKYNGSVVFYG